MTGNLPIFPDNVWGKTSFHVLDETVNDKIK